MTKQEAIQLMQEGKKLTHFLFTDEEWITMPDPFIIKTEDGYIRRSDEFWKYRKGDNWEEGWKIYEEDIELDDKQEHLISESRRAGKDLLIDLKNSTNAQYLITDPYKRVEPISINKSRQQNRRER